MCPTGPWIQLSKYVSECCEVLPLLRDAQCRFEAMLNAAQWNKKQDIGGGMQPDCPLQTVLKVAAERDTCISDLYKECKQRQTAHGLDALSYLHCIITTSCKQMSINDKKKG